jgi:hypothetical protein
LNCSQTCSDTNKTRILELARGPEDDDDGEADEQSDVGDQLGGGNDMVIQDNGSAPLNFQERSLREYFQAVDVDENGLRTPPSAAHLTIFEMAAEIMFKATDNVDADEQPKILEYASAFWVRHFVEIDMSKAKEDEVVRVVNILHRIITNHKNIALLFEHWGGMLYSEMLADTNASPWLNAVKAWAFRGTSVESVTLPTDVGLWAAEFAKLETPLMTLARGHVMNWIRSPNGTRIAEAWKFARDAFTWILVSSAWP